MDPNKSLDEIEIIAALIRDVQKRHGEVFNTRNCRNTINIVRRRVTQEGLGFLTKTLPRLGKCFDKALCENAIMNASLVGFSTIRGSKLPRFLGELFMKVFSPNGEIRPDPCVQAISDIRLILYIMYKYETAYTNEQEQQVIARFEKTEDDLSTSDKFLEEIRKDLPPRIVGCRRSHSTNPQTIVTRKARSLLKRLFKQFDPRDIQPRHGPGVVATKQRLWGKYHWSNVSHRISQMYPIDEYYFSSLTHVCDRLDSLKAIKSEDLPAKVILVPKDSRGPRLISCEPVDFQWIQQGLGRAIVEHVEHHYSTRFNVFFTDQSPNQRGALLGSMKGGYATLDLNEASDRVSTDLVHLLFPDNLVDYLDACRSSSTVLPDGRILKLRKFAPMGSCLCFPILALTIWAILTAAAPDGDTQESILVYGDDVIVPTHYASNAMSILESFGLKINRDKSCTSGFFRESCGTDAFKGVNVTPVRFRTVWASTPSPDTYCSWIAYANSLYSRGCYEAYDYIVGMLTHTYGSIPGKELNISAPSLSETALRDGRKILRRYNRSLQKVEYKVWDTSTPSITKFMDGWLMLLRYFAERTKPTDMSIDDNRIARLSNRFDGTPPSSVSMYTSRRTSMLVRRWR
jgi:hypothetical protein